MQRSCVHDSQHVELRHGAEPVGDAASEGGVGDQPAGASGSAGGPEQRKAAAGACT
jgi:hypothetical protein